MIDSPRLKSCEPESLPLSTISATFYGAIAFKCDYRSQEISRGVINLNSKRPKKKWAESIGKNLRLSCDVWGVTDCSHRH